MGRFDLLPSYHYEDNADGVITTQCEMPLRDYRIYGCSFQDGKPSPENPLEIKSVGDMTPDGKYVIPIEVKANGESAVYNIYLDEPLRSCGAYADYIDFGKRKVIRNTEYFKSIGDAIVPKGSWVPWYSKTPYYVTWGSMPMKGTNTAPLLSNLFSGSAVGEPNLDGAHFQRSSKYNGVYQKIPIRYLENYAGLSEYAFIDLSVAERRALIGEYMEANNVDCLVGLKTSAEASIELPQIKLYKGTNTITVKASVQPSAAEYQYYTY